MIKEQEQTVKEEMRKLCSDHNKSKRTQTNC